MKVVIHCSDSKFGNAALLAKWHVLPKPKGRGWSNIGYHLIILNGKLSSKAEDKSFDGYVETGRPLDDDNILESFEYGAHVRGENHKSVGVCLIGKSGKFTHKQLTQGVIKALRMLQKKFGKLEISQHSDYDKNKPYCAGLTKEQIEDIKYHFE